MQRIANLAATVLFFAACFVSPQFGYGEIGNAQNNRAEPVIPGQFIVLLNDAFDPAQVASDHAAIPLHTYRVASRGFAARLSEAQVNAFRSDPRVNNVVADRIITTAAKPGSAAATGEVLPTGINRIDAEGVSESAEIAATVVAIIDTGIDLHHDDLNVSSSCWFSAYGGNADDGNGHGTHVAGTVGAVANTTGVRGVAPGVTLCPVKVLDNSGSGAWSDIMAGIDYVTIQRNAGINIKVANMSLGGCATVIGLWCIAEPPPSNESCGKNSNGTIEDPLHWAICKSTAAGVVYSVAAGNDGEDALYFVPAAYPEVITVSAIADYNGKGGGGAKPPRGCNYGPDDSLANFSNYGAAVDIAAPGVCILSTYKGGGTKVLSGTSMATPHVTGAIALAPLDLMHYSSRDAAMKALQTRDQSTSCGFMADPDSAEPILYVGQPDTECGLVP